MERFDYELHHHLKSEEETFECQECGTPIEREYGYCSWDCHKASML